MAYMVVYLPCEHVTSGECSVLSFYYKPTSASGHHNRTRVVVRKIRSSSVHVFQQLMGGEEQLYMIRILLMSF